MFKNRRSAGIALAARLSHLDPATTVILALPRGGVPVAAEIADATGAPLDLLLVRKIGAPGQSELAIGAVVDGDRPQYVINEGVAETFGLSPADIEAMGARELEELRRRREVYLKGRAPLPLAGKTAVVVDDGIATGATMRAALKGLARQSPARIVLAVPVAAPSVLATLRDLSDEIICLDAPQGFRSVGEYYDDFDQVTDAEVIARISEAA